MQIYKWDIALGQAKVGEDGSGWCSGSQDISEHMTLSARPSDVLKADYQPLIEYPRTRSVGADAIGIVHFVRYDL